MIMKCITIQSGNEAKLADITLNNSNNNFTSLKQWTDTNFPTRFCYSNSLEKYNIPNKMFLKYARDCGGSSYI